MPKTHKILQQQHKLLVVKYVTERWFLPTRVRYNCTNYDIILKVRTTEVGRMLSL
jgi:hypothetical protein